METQISLEISYDLTMCSLLNHLT